MKILVHAIVIAPFVLSGALPATAGMAPCAPQPVALLKMADAGAFAADRGACAQKAKADMQEWRVKLDQFGESAKIDSIQQSKTTIDDLNKAWARARDSATKLETAGATDWESAKASFRKASDELSATWTKIRSDAKWTPDTRELDRSARK